MRLRLRKLGWNDERFRSALERAGYFTTPSRDSQLRTIRYWTSEHRHLPKDDRPWEVLADAEPPDPTLISQVHNIRSFQRPTGRAAAGRYYGLCLVRALDQTPLEVDGDTDGLPEQRSDNVRVWLAATHLVTSALKRSRQPRTIYIDAPGFDTTLGANRPGDAGALWRGTLRHALEEGWAIIHVLSWQQDDDVLPPAVQSDMVLNLLVAAREPGNYQPVLAATSGPAHVVAVEDYGALGVWDLDQPERPTRKVAVPLHTGEPGTDADSVRVANLLVDHARTLAPTRDLPSLWPYQADEDSYFLQFHTAQRTEEAAPNANRYMLKAIPPPVAAVPNSVWKDVFARLRHSEPEERRPYFAVHQGLLNQRQDIFLAATNQSTAAVWDIVTVRGVKEYLGIGVPEPVTRGGDILGLGHLKVEERQAHVRQLAHLALNQPGYRLAVVDEEALLVTTDPLWWIVIKNDSPRRGAVFFAGFGGEAHAERQGAWLYDSAGTNLVDGFVSLFQGIWDTLPPDSWNPRDVADLLMTLADSAPT